MGDQTLIESVELEMHTSKALHIVDALAAIIML